jgi:hypothetical protein
MRDVEHMHEVLCCAGTTSMLRYYDHDHYHGTGFGKARPMCVFITAVPNTKLWAWGEEDSGGHVL